jgi:hypothetical protein
MFIKHTGRTLMVLLRQMGEPAFNGFGIAKPASLQIAQPAAEAGSGGKDGKSRHKVHDAFGYERTGEQQQAVPG